MRGGVVRFCINTNLSFLQNMHVKDIKTDNVLPNGRHIAYKNCNVYIRPNVLILGRMV